MIIVAQGYETMSTRMTYRHSVMFRFGMIEWNVTISYVVCQRVLYKKGNHIFQFPWTANLYSSKEQLRVLMYKS